MGERRIWVLCSFNWLVEFLSFVGSGFCGLSLWQGPVQICAGGGGGGSGGGGGGGSSGSAVVATLVYVSSRICSPVAYDPSAPPPKKRRRAFVHDLIPPRAGIADPRIAPCSPSPQSTRKKEQKEKTKEKNILSGPCPGSPLLHPSASSVAESNSASASLSPPFQSLGPPKACLPVSRAPLRTALRSTWWRRTLPPGSCSTALVLTHLSVGGACCNWS